MVKKFAVLIAAAILVSTLGFTGSAVAMAAGAGPDNATAPAANWTPLAADQWAWYTFEYAGDGSQITVQMGVDANSPAAFSVWTPADVAQWTQDGTVRPVGRGSTDNALGGDLVWTGNFNTSGAYYVVVANANATPSSYLLKISGNGVWLPLPTAQQPSATAPAATAAPAAAAAAPTAAKPAGTGPGDAMAPSAAWTSLAAGHQTWYAFQYAGDGAQIIVRMGVDPSNPTIFSIWTPANVTQWTQDGIVNPIGRGSANAAFGGDLIWTGNFNMSGAYYVVVENASAAPSSYLLKIN